MTNLPPSTLRLESWLNAFAEQMWLTGRPDPRVTEWAVERLPWLAGTAEARLYTDFLRARDWAAWSGPGSVA